MKLTYFRTSSAFRAWLTSHHATRDELLVGFYKKDSGKPSISWPESVDEALCFGWIDGVRKGIDEIRYTIRFTPRKPGSIWSRVNANRAQALIEQGRMQRAGLKAYERRRKNKSGIYSYEQRNVELVEPYNRLLRENKGAWNFFHAQPASYRKASCWWVISARKEETGLKRLEKLTDYSAREQRLPQFTSRKSIRKRQ
jgi:uncharacterized protein YdeI (YjbR/CyaY-like superfamily)